MTPAELLARLGTTADEVAARLLDLGIRGRRGDWYGCPIARYLADHGHPSGVRLVGWWPVGTYSGCTALPDPVHSFVLRFDTFAYPELLEAA